MIESMVHSRFLTISSRNHLTKKWNDALDRDSTYKNSESLRRCVNMIHDNLCLIQKWCVVLFDFRYRNALRHTAELCIAQLLVWN